MVVEGLIHFKFTYCFVGQEHHVHEKDIYAADAEAARNQFAVFLINAPKCQILSVEVVESW